MRLADQVIWSGAFFLVNLVAVAQLSVSEYASLAIATSVGFIAVAVVRSGAITASIVAGASVRIPPQLAVGTLAPALATLGAAVLAALICGITLQAQGSTNSLTFALASGLMVMADVPRQILVASVQYGRALMVALAYAIGAAGIFLNYLLGAEVLTFAVAWILVLTAVFALGGLLQLGRESTALPRALLVSYGWRNGAEAFYAGVASQLAILIAFWLNDPAATAGLRLSYALVFAPAFTLVQGLMPILTNRIANAVISSERADARATMKRIATLWVAASAAVFFLCGVIAVSIVGAGWGTGSLSTVVPFLLPTGLNIIGGQTLEIAILVNRFSWSSRALHRMRLWTVGLEIGITIVAVLMFGLEGMVAALIILGLVKSMAGIWMIWSLRK